jgi:hypothetical protein
VKKQREHVIIKRKLEGVTMAKKKGQALVEFVIILPIFIFMLLAIIDFGQILYTQNQLENVLDLVIENYQQNQTLEELNQELKKSNTKQSVEIKNEEDYVIFTLKEQVNIITPFLNLFLNNPFEVITERAIKNES